ncbi:MAG TPA: ribonuclease HI family protein [Candidatus Paceibacterota bacterium]|nr:ribonuclease HI family protein [Candidatus Paceibacterota bacterium]
MKHKYIIHTDGGARGNPGPAAVGYVIEGPDIARVEKGEYAGETTNNEVEYRAPIAALKKLKGLIGSDKAAESEVEIYVDSELVAKQMNKEYKIKHGGLRELFMELWNLTIDFGSVTFYHVLRGKNSDADRLVNEALDREGSKLPL